MDIDFITLELSFVDLARILKPENTKTRFERDKNIAGECDLQHLVNAKGSGSRLTPRTMIDKTELFRRS